MDIKEIQKIIPHRFPFLLVDSILELEPGKRAVGLKNVTINEPFFTGHFPGNPVMPGVLIVEAMAQVGAVALLSLEKNQGKTVLFGGIDKVRFKKQVLPGDQLRMEVVLIKIKGSIGKGEGKAYVGDELAVSGQFLFSMAPS